MGALWDAWVKAFVGDSRTRVSRCFRTVFLHRTVRNITRDGTATGASVSYALPGRELGGAKYSIPGRPWAGRFCSLVASHGCPGRDAADQQPLLALGAQALLQLAKLKVSVGLLVCMDQPSCNQWCGCSEGGRRAEGAVAALLQRQALVAAACLQVGGQLKVRWCP